MPFLSGLLYTLVATAILPPQAAQDNVKVVSHGEQFVLEKSLQTDRPTVFVFYSGSSTAEKTIVEQLKEQARNSAHVGLRLIPLKSLAAPAARNYEILQTPTLLVLDRFGRLLVRTSKVEDIDPALVKSFKMARLKWVSESDPEAPKAYRMMGGGRQPVPEIMKTMSLRPELMEGIMRLAQTAHFSNGYLPRKTKEMIATYVSAINKCKY